MLRLNEALSIHQSAFGFIGPLFCHAVRTNHLKSTHLSRDVNGYMQFIQLNGLCFHAMLTRSRSEHTLT